MPATSMLTFIAPSLSLAVTGAFAPTAFLRDRSSLGRPVASLPRAARHASTPAGIHRARASMGKHENLWAEASHVAQYMEIASSIPHRAEGEAVVAELLPPSRPLRKVLDLGTGDGRLLAAVMAAHPEVVAAVAVDMSPPMLAAARKRFAADRRVRVVDHNMDEPLPSAETLLAGTPAAPAVGSSVSQVVAERSAAQAGDSDRGDRGGGDGDACFDAIVSSFAIHHLSDARKAGVYAEAAAMLVPGGVFINLEHVASPTEALHVAFMETIGEGDYDDPSNQLAPVEAQLEMLRAAGLSDVDCLWKWREMALLTGHK